YAVNIRAAPSTDAAVTGTVLPTELLPVTGYTAQGSSTWYQVSGGWVVDYASRLGGSCSGIPISQGVAPATISRPPQPYTGGTMAENFVPTENDLATYRYILFQDGSIWYNPRFQ
ncbi:MAG TPA: SH3 domain-containing protein, partial [Aggregatilineales bacterium]|nr:SH3 domain-containing protein [Aggregatilineales bacterium]